VSLLCESGSKKLSVVPAADLGMGDARLLLPSCFSTDYTKLKTLRGSQWLNNSICNLPCPILFAAILRGSYKYEYLINNFQVDGVKVVATFSQITLCGCDLIMIITTHTSHDPFAWYPPWRAAPSTGAVRFHHLFWSG